MGTGIRELTIPPRTGVARGFMTSAPLFVDHMIDSMPATTVATVMIFGRITTRRQSTRMARPREHGELPEPSCRDIEPLEHKDEHDLNHDSQSYLGANLVLILAAPLDVIARRHHAPSVPRDV
jgi:hypothetical protein